MQSLPQHLAGAPEDNVAIAVADGEHYPAAVRDTIVLLGDAGWNIVAVALTGGTEKLRDEPDYGVPHAGGSTAIDALDSILARRSGVTHVLDLADEPALVFENRMATIGACAARGLTYVGADVSVPAPPQLPHIGVPTLAIIGTGKRIGKTAVSAHLARLADHALGGRGDVVVVAMGRGGPADPVMVDRATGPTTVERLLEISRSGAHAASDFLEDAALTGLTTVGCRRVGGGILGLPVSSNVGEGATLAASLKPRLVVLEGSGSCIPPVHADASLLIGSTDRPRDLISDLGTYRQELADLTLVLGERADDTVALAQQVSGPAIAARLAPRPAGDVSGKRVAVFTTAAPAAAPVFHRALDDAGAHVVLVSTALAHRETLRGDVERALTEGIDAFVVEIKAAGIDVVAEAAVSRDVEVVFLDNRPVPHDPTLDLDAALSDFALAATKG